MTMVRTFGCVSQRKLNAMGSSSGPQSAFCSRACRACRLCRARDDEHAHVEGLGSGDGVGVAARGLAAPRGGVGAHEVVVEVHVVEAAAVDGPHV